MIYELVGGPEESLLQESMKLRGKCTREGLGHVREEKLRVDMVMVCCL